jgi:RNA polymerase sigma-32 factor
MKDEKNFSDLPTPSILLPPLDEQTPAEGSAALEVFDPLKKYLMEIRKFSLLSREEEMKLAKRWWEERDRLAAYRLVVSNLRLVVKIAFEYQRAYTNLLDLIQASIDPRVTLS